MTTPVSNILVPTGKSPDEFLEQREAAPATRPTQRHGDVLTYKDQVSPRQHSNKPRSQQTLSVETPAIDKLALLQPVVVPTTYKGQFGAVAGSRTKADAAATPGTIVAVEAVPMPLSITETATAIYSSRGTPIVTTLNAVEYLESETDGVRGINSRTKEEHRHAEVMMKWRAMIVCSILLFCVVVSGVGVLLLSRNEDPIVAENTSIVAADGTTEAVGDLVPTIAGTDNTVAVSSSGIVATNPETPTVVTPVASHSSACADPAQLLQLPDPAPISNQWRIRNAGTEGNPWALRGLRFWLDTDCDEVAVGVPIESGGTPGWSNATALFHPDATTRGWKTFFGNTVGKAYVGLQLDQAVTLGAIGIRPDNVAYGISEIYVEYLERDGTTWSNYVTLEDVPKHYGEVTNAGFTYPNGKWYTVVFDDTSK